MRGSSKLPAFTPRRPPQPSSTRAGSSNTSTSRPLAGPRRSATAAIASARRCAGGQLAKSHDSAQAPASTCPRRAPASSSAAWSPSATRVSASSPTPPVRRLQDVVAVAGQEHALRGDLARQPWADPLERWQQEGEASPRAGGASERAGRVAEPVGVQRPGLPDAHHHQRRAPCGARQHERLSGLPREPGRFEGGPIVADLVRDRARRRDEHAHGLGIGRSAGRRADRDLRHPADPRRGIEVRGHGD